LAHWNDGPSFVEILGPFHSETKSPAFGRAIENIANVMKREHLRSEETQVSVRFVT